MPYQAMKETWRESHEAAGLYEEMDNPLLPWWWGLWIGTNVLQNLAFMFGRGHADALEGATYADLIAGVLNVPLCLVLIRLMQRLSRAQRIASQTAAFE